MGNQSMGTPDQRPHPSPLPPGEGVWCREREHIRLTTSHFHPVIREWFEERFREPTEAQAQGWAAVAQGKHTLIAAPTGSGKTLAAFLTCIDRLVRQGIEGDLPDTTQVVYVSPLKALSNDIQREPGRPAGGDRCPGCPPSPGRPTLPRSFPGGCWGIPGNPRGAAHRGHAAVRTPENGEKAAAHPHHHPRVPVYPAHIGQRQAWSLGRQHADPGRDPRRCRRQARLPSLAFGGATLRPLRAAGGPHRAVGHAAAHRGDRPAAGGERQHRPPTASRTAR